MDEAKTRIAELEAQLIEANARAAVVVNLFKGFQMLAEGKITEETFDSILKRTEADLAKAADWLAGYTEALMLKIAAQSAQLKVAREALKNYPTLDANKMADLAVYDWQNNEHNLLATFESHLRAFSLKAEQYRKQALAALDGEVRYHNEQR